MDKPTVGTDDVPMSRLGDSPADIAAAVQGWLKTLSLSSICGMLGGNAFQIRDLINKGWGSNSSVGMKAAGIPDAQLHGTVAGLIGALGMPTTVAAVEAFLTKLFQTPIFGG